MNQPSQSFYTQEEKIENWTDPVSPGLVEDSGTNVLNHLQPSYRLFREKGKDSFYTEILQ